jgi:hypothetical protein
MIIGFKDTYESVGSPYSNSDSGVGLMENPREGHSGLEDNFLEDTKRIVTRDKSLARDYTQDSGE